MNVSGRQISLAAVAAFGLLTGTAVGAEYTVDAGHANVGFRVRHILTRLPGRFREFEGTFRFDPGSPEKTSGRFTAKAASIDTNLGKRDAHLRSQDFFWADRYPEMTLAVKRLARGAAERRYVAEADLTIRGVTKNVSLDVEYLGSAKSPWGTSVASFSAHGTISRKDFGLAWNKVLESCGVLVGDEVELLLDIEGVESAPSR